MLKLMKKLARDQRGITGLETAIILIAFVVVAAVFAYTALSAGIFSAQKGQETIYSGLKQAAGSMEIYLLHGVCPHSGGFSDCLRSRHG
ncbi:MAG: flab1 [Dehalococcoidia bacterium]|nr:flab1 [Dehalococcoidia bacterium]